MRTAGGGGLSDEERVKKGWREKYGLSEARLQRKWAEFLRCEAFRSHLEGQPSDPSSGPESRLTGIDLRVAEYRAGLLAQR